MGFLLELWFQPRSNASDVQIIPVNEDYPSIDLFGGKKAKYLPSVLLYFAPRLVKFQHQATVDVPDSASQGDEPLILNERVANVTRGFITAFSSPLLLSPSTTSLLLDTDGGYQQLKPSLGGSYIAPVRLNSLPVIWQMS